MELSERVSSARLTGWEAELPAPRSRQAIVEVADASTFLRLLPEEIPSAPALDRVRQVAFLTLIKTYLTDTIPKLPNFFATRNITRSSNEPEKNRLHDAA